MATPASSPRLLRRRRRNRAMLRQRLWRRLCMYAHLRAADLSDFLLGHQVRMVLEVLEVLESAQIELPAQAQEERVVLELARRRRFLAFRLFEAQWRADQAESDRRYDDEVAAGLYEPYLPRSAARGVTAVTSVTEVTAP